jgi:hypothetical protein
VYFRNTVGGVESGDSSNGTTTPVANITISNKKTEDPEKGTITPVFEGSNTTFLPLRSYVQTLQLFMKMPGRPSLKQLFTIMYRPLLIM